MANIAAASRITRRRPMISERIPAGRLTTIPTTVDAAAINPTVDMGTSRDRMNSGNTGFFAIVELQMARPPMIQSRMNGDILSLIIIFRVGE